MDIVTRSLKKEDRSQIREIIHEAWGFDEYKECPKTVAACLNLYLFYYLAESNFARVAEYNGKVVSFLFGRCSLTSRVHFRFRFIPKLLATLFCLLFSKTGRQELHNARVTLKTDNGLLRQHRKAFDGELCLFATDKNDRGHGAGHVLLNEFHAFMRERGAKHYFVYTDTYSNYQFYDNHGYERVSGRTVDFDDNEAILPQYFLYRFDLARDIPDHTPQA